MNKGRQFLVVFIGLLCFAGISQAQVKTIKMKVAGHLCSMCTYNIQKAVTYLEFGPELEDFKVLDLKQGLCSFTPKPDKPVSFEKLKAMIKKTGFKLISAEITVSGKLLQDNSSWQIESAQSKQHFVLMTDGNSQALKGTSANDNVEIMGDWQASDKGVDGQEIIHLTAAKKSVSLQAKNKPKADNLKRVKVAGDKTKRVKASVRRTVPSFLAGYKSEESLFRHAGYTRQPVGDIKPDLRAATKSAFLYGTGGRFEENKLEEIKGSLVTPVVNAKRSLAPVRTTSPSLAVYKGGEVWIRYAHMRQHLGDIRVDHHAALLGFTYTPTTKLQLGAEVPYHTYNGRTGTDSAHNAGNAMVWGKYRFYNSPETGGDSQAAIQLALEVPTARKNVYGDGPFSDSDSEFVRRQLFQIDGGYSAHLNTSYSRAKNRWIYGASVEYIGRSEFAQFRLGDEVRFNTDLEYALSQGQGRELRLILETTYSHKKRGRLNGREVSGSTASEFYVAPALQFALKPQFIIEGSYQLPVILNTGPQLLRTDRSLLLGVRFRY